MASDKAIEAAWAVIENMSFDETSDKECMRAALDAAAAVDGAAQPAAPSIKSVIDYECGWNDACDAVAKAHVRAGASNEMVQAVLDLKRG